MTKQIEQPVASRLPLEEMPQQLSTIQPGGGFIIHLEMAWGYLRRCYLKTFRKTYLAHMESLRKGDFNPCPHECLDPRDLKYYQNQGGWHWAEEDDPFTWRNNLPFARVGLAELFFFSLLFFGLAGLLTYLIATQVTSLWGTWTCFAGIIVCLFCGTEIAWFFRNPKRNIPATEGTVVSPADGKIVLIEEREHDDYLDGPAVVIGIFLSIFNVHINRSPIAARVIGLTYQAGKHLNALRPESARENEQLAIRIEGNQAPYRRMIVKQITGAIARRIVCWIRPGSNLKRGEQFGMIKLGSRTELILPKEEGMQIVAQLGSHVQAGESILIQYLENQSE